ncbi:unnamed protein product, partial [marine sediment metagenome]
DNPVVRINKNDPNGIIYDSTQIYLPLNQRAILKLYGRGNELIVQNYQDISEVFKLNCFIAKNATEYIICSNSDYLVRILESIKYDYILHN